MPEVSVIIPVYNVEAYIERCARSLFEQTLQNMEFIFVDDCSTDRSITLLKKVIEDYPQRKEQIHIWPLKRNSGPSVARNMGLSMASGEYIIFCDSDDWVEREMYDKLYTCASRYHADICYCDFYMVYQDGIKHTESVEYVKDKAKLLKKYLAEGLTIMWNMLVKKEIYLQHKLKFPNDIVYCEDFWLSLRLMYFSRKIVKVSEPLYFYNRTNQSSLLIKAMERTRTDELNAVCNTISFFAERGELDLYKKELSWRILKAKQDMVLHPDEYQDFLTIYPDSHAYILSCPEIFCNRKIKIMMWLIAHRMNLLVTGINKLRQILGR